MLFADVSMGSLGTCDIICFQKYGLFSVETGGAEMKSIAVLSPYNKQLELITERLQEAGTFNFFLIQIVLAICTTFCHLVSLLVSLFCLFVCMYRS